MSDDEFDKNEIVCDEFQEASYCKFFLLWFYRFVLCKLFLYYLPLLLDMNEIESLTVYKVFFCPGFEYMHVSIHLYKHLAFFICCKVFKSFFHFNITWSRCACLFR